MINKGAVNEVQCELSSLLGQLSTLQDQIREKLIAFSDGKTLKGNEIVGWLGEIYGKLLLGGQLVSDSEEHDIQTDDNQKISVKTRKGWNSGWKQTSAIPKIEGDECPTHLLFVHLNDDYSVDRMWLFEWNYLRMADRFKSHLVRGSHRSYIFILDERTDNNHAIYSGTHNKAPQNSQKHKPFWSINSEAIDNRIKQQHMTDTDNPSQMGAQHSIAASEKFRKINRIKLWADRSHQNNHKIIMAFLELEKNGTVYLNDLKSSCSNKDSKYYVKKFDEHYASMKTDSGNSHGNVFFEKNGIVNIWPRVREEIREHFKCS